jgi:hypothetical protein
MTSPESRAFTFRGVPIPESLRESIDRYVTHGTPTGGFLEACIDNDLRSAVLMADEVNSEFIPVVVSYLYNECPATCWGNPGRRVEWVQTKQLERAAQRRQCAHVGGGQR